MDEDAEAASGNTTRTSGRVAEVLRVATALSDQVLRARIINLPVPDHQIAALENAAHLLKEHAIPLPPQLMQVLHEISADRLVAALACERQATDADGQSREGDKS